MISAFQTTEASSDIFLGADGKYYSVMAASARGTSLPEFGCAAAGLFAPPLHLTIRSSIETKMEGRKTALPIPQIQDIRLF